MARDFGVDGRSEGNHEKRETHETDGAMGSTGDPPVTFGGSPNALLRTTKQTSTRAVSQSPPMILRPVQDSEDDDRVPFNAEEELVGKATGQHATKPAIVVREVFRILFQSKQSFGDGSQELVSQSGATLLVLIVRFQKVRPRHRTDGDAPFHLGDWRTCWSASRQGWPGS